MNAELTDDQLMIRLQEGDSSAFTLLVERYQSALVGFFVKNTRDIHVAEDLSQETLLKIYNQAWDYLPLGRFRPWMFRIARNLLIDNVRKRAHDALVQAVRRTHDDDDDLVARLADEILTPDKRAQIAELKTIVDELLAEIPEDQRQTFILHHFSSLSLAEVAEAMDVPLATSKSRLRLAREKLQEKLRLRGLTPRVFEGEE